MRLLDTTLLVDFVRRKEAAQHVIRDAEARGERCTTTEMNAFELLMGGFGRGRPNAARLTELQRFLDTRDVLPLERAGALRAAGIAARLRSEGRDLGTLDVLIAGAALAAGYDTIVTRDEAFRRVPGLKVQTY